MQPIELISCAADESSSFKTSAVAEEDDRFM